MQHKWSECNKDRIASRAELDELLDKYVVAYLRDNTVVFV